MASYVGMINNHQGGNERIDRGATWSDPEVDELLNIWTNESVQAELKEATIKKHIFERIARSLREKGFYRTAEQCREKIKRLKKEYRQAKNNNYRCVRGRATVKFFPRLQAVLDGKPNNNNNNTGSGGGGGGGGGAILGNNIGGSLSGKVGLFSYDGSEFHQIRQDGGAHGGRPGSGSGSTASYLGRKGSPHSFSDYTAEEIKVEINPAEVDNDSCVNSEAGEDAEDMLEVDIPRHSAAPTSRHFSRSQHMFNHSLLHSAAAAHLPVTAHSLSLPNHHNHHHHRQNHQALALTVNSSSHHPLNYSNNINNNNGVLGAGRLSEDERDCPSEASSSRIASPISRNIRPHSPADSMHLPRRKKLKRSRSSANISTVKETLDATLDRFLKHQREAEERLFAWEERRIQMELEAEERWRQEDRELLRQIVTHLYLASNPCVTNASTSTGPASPPMESHNTSSSTSSDQ